jgi:hypothetical protein
MKYYKKIIVITLAASVAFECAASAADSGREYSYFADYASGCAMGIGSGLVGAGLASSKLEPNTRMTTNGYAVSGLLGCLTGMAIVGVIGNQAEFNTAWRYEQDITNLSYELARANKERCLLTARCQPAGNAIIVETDDGTKKVGDKVITSTTFTLEANE